MNFRDLETPALILDLDLMEKNIRKMSDYFRSRKAKLRPHVKNHKTPIIALKEIQAGAVGVAVAKLEEAEVMAYSGIQDILLMNQIVTDKKIERLLGLTKHASVTVAVDNKDNVTRLANMAEKHGVKLPVVIEVDIGHHRAGVSAGREALLLAQEIDSLDSLRFKGLAGYEGHVSLIVDPDERKREDEKACSLLMSSKEMIEDKGIAVEMVSAGGTGTYDLTGNYPGITEVQAGSYVTMDVVYRDCGIDFDCALSVLTTVTSTPSEDRAILDAGLKSITMDQGLPRVKDLEGVVVHKLSAEHTHLELKPNHSSLKIGDKVEVYPSDTDTTINMHDQFYGVRDGEVEVVWPILARGKSR
jgi:D-serine deaminase-like pyridoxal phosphate-dependent protein